MGNPRYWPMTCSIPHDDCPLFEEAEDHLACLDSHCCWAYANPRRNAMSDDDAVILIDLAEKRAHGPIRE